jgi:hypothetical protein
MPVFPSQDLYGKKICETYQQILQIYSGSVLNGAGSQQQFLNVTASYVIHAQTGSGTPIYTGSYYPITSSWALNGGTRIYTGSTYPITSSWSNNTIYSVTASYASNFGNSITQSFYTSSTWVFDHNLGQKEVIVQTYDQNDYWIVPQSINLFDENTAIIQFSVPRTGTAIATRGGVRVLISGSGQSCCLQTGSTYPITASWATNALNGGTKLYTGSTYPITSSWALSASFALTASYIGDSIVGTFISSSTWTFTHNLEDRPVLIQAYDINYNQIVPADIVLIDDNTAVLTFPISESGYAIATRCGYRSVVTGTAMYTGSTYPITSSWALNTITSSYIQVTGVSYPVRKINNNYTIVRTTDYTILCDATSGSFDVKLPNPSGNTNIYNIKKIDRSGHCVNVMVTNASYIDYDVTQSICHRGTNMTIQSDGTNQYWIL